MKVEVIEKSKYYSMNSMVTKVTSKGGQTFYITDEGDSDGIMICGISPIIISPKSLTNIKLCYKKGK